MKDAVTAESEVRRVACLEGYGILDTPPESGFDDLTRLAARCCDVPIALINFVAADRQWTKSHLGWALKDVARTDSFCAQAISRTEPLLIPDLAKDERFAKNRFVVAEPKVRCYAGAPLISPDGFRIGTLCVLDQRPRRFTPEQIETLQVLAQQVMAQLELRRADHVARHADGSRQRLLRHRVGGVHRRLRDGLGHAVERGGQGSGLTGVKRHRGPVYIATHLATAKWRNRKYGAKVKPSRGKVARGRRWCASDLTTSSARRGFRAAAARPPARAAARPARRAAEQPSAG